MLTRILFAVTLCSPVFCSSSNAQDCVPPRIVANAKTANLFSSEQEMIFGELIMQNRAGGFRLVRDDRLLAFVNEIGERLTKHLPPTGLRFQFHLIDIPQANAFNITGGHVLLSRKLVALVDNEDELAGVIGHELGHATVRHAATDTSELLRKILNITALGDRKDITEKYNLLIERARTKRFSRGRSGHENDQQLEADRIGLFAMIAAGYDPAAFSSFFDRLTESEGKTGNWFSDLFGSTRPEQKRLREMIRITEQLSPACRDRRASKSSEDFLRWQADVVSFREAQPKEELPGLISKKELAPKLRSDVYHFAFSPDGRFLLAQDDFGVTVIERGPMQVLFQIPVENADEAAFTSDGKFVIFTTRDLRYEKWDVAGKRPVELRELVLRRSCWEHKLSPDGSYLACVDSSISANIFDIKTGQKVWEQKSFYRLLFNEYFLWLESTRHRDRRQVNFFRIEFSPDSRSVIFSRSETFRFRLRVDGATALSSENATLALDLTTLKPIDVGGDLKKIAAHPYIFLDSEKILGRSTGKTEDGGIFSFPSGKRLQKFIFGGKEIERTANPDYVIVKPIHGAKMGVFDLKKGIVPAGLNKEDAAIWNNLMAYEATSGKILFREISFNEKEKTFDTKDVGAIEIPVGLIKGLDAAQVSDSFAWLLLSSKTRGGLWNLATGERKFYVRGFKGGVVANDGGAVGDFPKLDEQQHSLAMMNPRNNTVAPIRELPEKGAQQYGRFVLLRRGLKEQEKKEDAKRASSSPGDDESDGPSLGQNVRFELKDFIEDKVIWSRDYPKEAPEYSFDEFSGRLIFYWRLGSDAGKARLNESADLKARADTLGNNTDDYLVEIVDAFAQKPVGTILLETGKGSFDVGGGLSEGDWLMLHDSAHRVLVYSIKGGDLRHRFFGGNAAINPRRNQIAVENFPGEITLYDLDSGDRQANFIIDGRAAFVRFNLEGNRFFVLSGAQSSYVFDLNKLEAKQTTKQ